MSETFNPGIKTKSEEKRRHIFNLFQHFQSVKSKNASEPACMEEVLQGATAGLFEKVVKIAIHDSDRSARKQARKILLKFAENGERRPSLV
jgi:hypothetical protein